MADKPPDHTLSYDDPEEDQEVLENRRDRDEILPGDSARAARADTLPQIGIEELGGFAELEPGAQVHRYLIHERLGAGGMGVVYAAYDPELDRKIALKFLHPGPAAHADRRHTRLLREAQAMARLSHPNVAAVHDVGTYRGQVFLAMEFVAGSTLGQWLAAEERDWRAVRRLFVDAGHGLAAAHAAGVMHRDFKPDNVLVTGDGRAKVTDFGLARALDSGDSEEVEPTDPPTAGRPSGSSSGRVLDSPLTATGTALGTPRYMSPEQHLGKRADARSDQFAVAVALWEALFGELPYPGDNHAAIRSAVTEGPIAEPAHSERAPRWLRQVVTRALSRDPDQRYPSMDALLEALGRDPAARRRRLGLVALAVAALAGGGYYVATRDHAPAPCRRAADRLAGIWDAGQRAAVRSAFDATGRPYAADTFQRVTAILDDYAAKWVAMHQDACAATHIRGEQSAALLDLRMRCLEQRRLELGALTTLLAEKPDPTVLDKAVDAAYGLPAVAGCADVDNLKALVPLPDDPAVRKRIADLEDRLRQVDVRYGAGKYQDARGLAEGIVKELGDLDYPPVVALARWQLGGARARLGDYASAEKDLYAATKAAAAAGDRDLEARIWIRLLHAVGHDQARFAEAEVLARSAAAAVARAGNALALRIALGRATALMLLEQRKIVAATQAYQDTIGLMTQADRPESLELASCLSQLGVALIQQGKLDDAEPPIRRAMEIDQRLLGPGHPDLAYDFDTLANLASYRGNYQEAAEYYQRAVDLQEKFLGPNDLALSGALGELAWAQAELGHFDQALASARRALDIRKSLPPDHPDLATTENALGSILAMAGKYDEGSRHLQVSLEISLKKLGPDSPDVAVSEINLGLLANQRGVFDRALDLCQRARQIMDRQPDDTAVYRNALLTCLGKAHLGKHELGPARNALEQALTVGTEQGLAPAELAETRFALARALWPKPTARPRAHELAVTARDALQAATGYHERDLKEMMGWLAAHPLP